MSKYAQMVETPEGGDFVNPSVGEHPAHILGVAFLIPYAKDFRGKKKKPSLHVAIRFKLYDMDEETGEIIPCEGGDYITSIIAFKWHELASFTKMLAKLYPKKCTVKEKPSDDLFDKMIDHLPAKACMVDIEPDGKKKNDDGSPSYVAVKGVRAVNALTAKAMPELDESEVAGILVGEDVGIEELKWLKSYEAYKFLVTQEAFSDSHFPALIKELRKSDEDYKDYGKKPEKSEDEDSGDDGEERKGNASQNSKPNKPAKKDDDDSSDDLDEDEEF